MPEAAAKASTSAPARTSAGRPRVAPKREPSAAPSDLAALHEKAGNQAVGNLVSTPSVIPSEARALDPGVRAVMESRFRRDFGAVRVHSGERSAELARSKRAAAFTQGSNIVLGEGKLAQIEPKNRSLLAHELAHVVQQSGNGSGTPGADHEREAERAASLAGGSGPIDVALSSAPGSIQCAPEDQPKRSRKIFIDSQTLVYIADGNHPEAEAALKKLKQEGAQLYITKQSQNELFEMPERFQNPGTEKDRQLVPKIQASFARREEKMKELGITPGPTGDQKARWSVYAANLRETKIQNKQTKEVTSKVHALLSEPHLVPFDDPAEERKTEHKKNDVLVAAQVKAAGGELFTIDADFLRRENKKAVGPKEGLKEHLGLVIAPESWSVPLQPLSSRPPKGGGGGASGTPGGRPAPPPSPPPPPPAGHSPTHAAPPTPPSHGAPAKTTGAAPGSHASHAAPVVAPTVPAPPEPPGTATKAAKRTTTRKKRVSRKQAVMNAALQSAASGPAASTDPAEVAATPTTRKPRKRAAAGQTKAYSPPVDAPPVSPDAAIVEAQSPTKKKRKSGANAGAPAGVPSPPVVAAQSAAPDAPAAAKPRKPRKSRGTASPAPGALGAPGADPGPSLPPPAPPRQRARKPAAPRQKRIPANDPETSFKDIGDEFRKDPGQIGLRRAEPPRPLTLREHNERIHAGERKTTGEDGDPTPLSIPKYGVHMPWTGVRRSRDKKGHERNKSSELGFERDPDKFWKEYDGAFQNHLSPAQKKRIAEGHAPVVDDHWIKTYPEHAAFKGQPLIHHHVGQGSFAVALPEDVHRAHSVMHPDRATLGTRKKAFSQKDADKALEDQQKRLPGRQDRELRRHAKEGRFDNWGYGKGKVPPVGGKVPLASPLAGVSDDGLAPQAGASARFRGSAAPAKTAAQQPPAHPPEHTPPTPPPTAVASHPAPPRGHVQHPAPPQPVDAAAQAPAHQPPPLPPTPPMVHRPVPRASAAAPPPPAAHDAAPPPPAHTASPPPPPAHHAPPPPPAHADAHAPSHPVDTQEHPPSHVATRSVDTTRGAGLLLGPNQRGVQAHAGFAASQQSASGTHTSQTVNVGGKMWAKVDEVPLSSPPRFKVTVTVDLRADAGITGGKEGQGGGSAGLSASVSAQLTWATTTPELSAEDAKAYMGSIQSGTGSAPEMNLARLIARGRIPDAKAYLARLKGLTKSADAAANAGEGETATFIQATRGDVGANVSKGPVGLEVSVSKSQQLQISRTKKNGKVYVSISIIGETAKHLGGSLNILNTSFGVNHTAAVNQSKGATFVLDPKAADFTARFNSLMAVDTVEDLRHLIGANKPVEETTGHGTSHETGVKATVLGGGFQYGEGGALTHEDIKNEDGSMTHRVEGSGTGNAAFVAGDKSIAKYSQTDTFTGEVGKDNVGSGETRTARSETDLAKSASAFYGALKKDTWGTIAGLPKGQTPVLKEKNEAEGKFLDDDAFGSLYGLSQDAHAWSKHCNRPADLIEWNQLGAKVAASGGDRAKIQALMASFESKGTDRNKYINQAVGLVGEAYEFPDSLADLEPTYRELVRGNPVAHANELVAAGKNADATAELTAATGKLNQMLKQIRDHSADFQHNPDAYASMQEAISRKLGAIRTAMRKAAPPPPKRTSIGAPTPDEAKKEDEADTQAAAKAGLEDEIAGKIDVCQGNRKSESEMFAAIRAEFAKDNEPWYDFAKSDIYVINDKLSRLKELYARWDRTVEELRSKYEAHGDSPDKANAYKPDRGAYNDLHRKANGAWGGY